MLVSDEDFDGRSVDDRIRALRRANRNVVAGLAALALFGITVLLLFNSFLVSRDARRQEVGDQFKKQARIDHAVVCYLLAHNRTSDPYVRNLRGMSEFKDCPGPKPKPSVGAGAFRTPGSTSSPTSIAVGAAPQRSTTAVPAPSASGTGRTVEPGHSPSPSPGTTTGQSTPPPLLGGVLCPVTDPLAKLLSPIVPVVLPGC